jgi:hypothetical protein
MSPAEASLWGCHPGNICLQTLLFSLPSLSIRNVILFCFRKLSCICKGLEGKYFRLSGPLIFVVVQKQPETICKRMSMTCFIKTIYEKAIEGCAKS